MRTIPALLIGFGLISANYSPASLQAAPAIVEPLAQIQAVLVNDVPIDAPTIEQLQVKRASGATEAGRVGMQLNKDDEVKTGDKVEASLLYTKPTSEYYVQVLMQEGSHARIGSLWAYVGKFLISGWGTFDTQTQNVRLAKKATEFYIEVFNDGAVDLKVLRGEVDVETVAGTEPGEQLEHSHRRWTGETAKVDALHGLKIEKGQRLASPRPLQTGEVETLITKTDKLMIASLADTTPLNVIPTSFEIDPEFVGDPQSIKRAATAAFKNARRQVTLNPTAENIASLGDAYKDMGAGKQAANEYEEAVKIKPALQNSVEFLASQAEAYRLYGNLKKAAEKSDEAVKKSSAATPFEKRLALNARGNVSYDVAVLYVAAGKWDTAGTYFKESKNLFESASLREPNAKNQYWWIAERNLLNVSLAIGPGATVNPALTKFMGTYRGFVTFPAAAMEGPATLVISGNRFSLINCDDTLSGSIIPRKQDGDSLILDVLLDTSMPIKTLSLKASLVSEKRIELRNSADEKNRFSFSTALKQYALQCLRTYDFP